jgi:hypothetical protein
LEDKLSPLIFHPSPLRTSKLPAHAHERRTIPFLTAVYSMFFDGVWIVMYLCECLYLVCVGRGYVGGLIVMEKKFF